MRSRQAGITFIGWLFILVPIAIVAYAAIRSTPVVLNYFKVSQALERTATALEGDETLSQRNIKFALEKQFDIDMIEEPEVKDILIRKDGATWTMQAQYQGVAPLFSNMSLVFDFDKTVTIE